jgi:hypothetical protein
MLAEDLELLLDHDDVPAVSILGPPEAAELAELRAEAIERIGELADDDPDPILLDGIDAGVDKALGATSPAVGIFVSPSLVHVTELPLPVQPRVVVDATFATRDLVAALARGHRYLVLTVDGREARLLAGLGERLQPIGVTAGFPITFPALEAVGERALHQEPSRRRDAHIDRCHRLVDDALAVALRHDDPRAVFVVGDERRAHRFAATSTFGHRIAAVIGSTPGPELDDLRRVIAEARDAQIARVRHQAMQDVGNAIGQGRFAGGLVELWELAHDARIELLVVEEGYRQAAELVDGGRLALVDEPIPGHPDDAVDELIELVLATGGTVEAVADGAIEDWGRVAAKLRH